MGTGPIWLDEVTCSPGITSLSNCVHNGLNNSDCKHAEDAGVSCHRPAGIKILKYSILYIYYLFL